MEGKERSSKGWKGQEKMKDENLRMKCRIWGGGCLMAGALPQGTPNDKGAWLRTDGSPTDEDHGPVLHLGDIEHAWSEGRVGEESRAGGRKRAGERVH